MSVDYDHLYELNLLEKHEPLTQREKDTLIVMEDNKAAIDWAKKAGACSKMRHLETQLLWIKRSVADKVIKLQHVPTKEQIADIFLRKPQLQPCPQTSFRSSSIMYNTRLFFELLTAIIE